MSQTVVIEKDWASQVDTGTAITQVTVDAAHNVLNIPAGKGGILKGVEATVSGTLETVVNDGGEMILTNSSADWAPFQFVVGLKSAVDAGGASAKPVMIPCNKKLPGNSVVTASYHPYDNQSQFVQLRLFWELTDEDPEFETFSSGLMPLKTEAVTSTSRAAVAQAARGNQIAIPGDKGGRMTFLQLLNFPTMETVVNSGGLLELENDAIDITPAHFTLGAGSVITEGGHQMSPSLVPFPGNVIANSNYNAFYTPLDDQSQTVSLYVMWERPFKPKR